MTNFFKKAPDIRKRKRLKPVSKKRQIINVQRAQFVRDQLEKRPDCEACAIAVKHIRYDDAAIMASLRKACGGHGVHPATEIHEPLSRARKPGAETILDAANTIAVCHGAHAWIHAHPAAAERMWLLKSSRGLR